MTKVLVRLLRHSRKTPDAIDKIQETLNNGKKYNSFSGIDKNMSGNVKFILKVQEISNDK